MKISPVTNIVFAKNITRDEFARLKKEAENAKSMRTALENKAFLSVEGGMQAWFRAKDAGFLYADNKPEGERYRQAWQAYTDAHTHPLKKGEKEAKEEFKQARKAYYNKASIGRELYFFENAEDDAIREEAVKKMMETEEGRQAIYNDEHAAVALQLASNNLLEKD